MVVEVVVSGTVGGGSSRGSSGGNGSIDIVINVDSGDVDFLISSGNGDDGSGNFCDDG